MNKETTIRKRPAAVILTPAAEARIAELMSKAPDDAIGVKLSTPRRGCSGLAYSVDYVSEADKFDEHIETPGGDFYIDGGSVLYLVGSTMDWVEDDFAAGFTFNNPNATGACGCGESFMVQTAPTVHKLKNIDNWVFDLDNTLYPKECGLYQHMDLRIRNFVARHLGLPDDEAHKVQKGYFRSHGTTLAGLMEDHGTDPYEYLEDVHQFPLETLKSAPRFTERLKALPGRKIIFTNADAPYAARVLSELELEGIFDDIVDIHACAYKPKPADHAYDTLLSQTGIDPERSIFFEDMARNLAPAKSLGMTTVWIRNGSDLGDLESENDHIDHRIDSLAGFLDSAIETLKS